MNGDLVKKKHSDSSRLCRFTEYTWTLERDKEKTDSALLASTDDSKDFTYEDGVLSYEVSAMGTTTTLELKKN